MLLLSCGTLRLTRRLAEPAVPWQMYGKDPDRNSRSQITSDSLERIWDQDVGAGFGNSSAAVAGGIVYVGTLKGEVHALDVSTGKDLASKNFGGAIFSCPVVLDSLMVVAASQSKKNLLAYDIYSGSLLWSKSIADVELSPAVRKNEVYVATVNGDLYKFDLRTGDEVFHKNFGAPVRSSPAIDDSVCVFGCDDGNVYAVDAADGKLKWKYEAGSPVWCSPSMNDSSVFVGTNGGELLALTRKGKLEFDFTTGEKILSMPVSDEKRIYFGCDDGNFYALDIDSGALLWKVNADAPIITAAAETRTQIFVGGFDKILYVIDKSDGKVVQKIDLSGRIRTQPAIYGDYLVIGAEDEEIYGFRIR